MATKAQTLMKIHSILQESSVPDFVIITVEEWKQNKESALRKIQEKLKGRTVIVRSSALVEDGETESFAGAFDSVKDVDINDSIGLSNGIDKVIKSYKNASPDNEILVQNMINNVSMSGVVFTHELNYGSPYYVINYDDISGLTDTVTSGDGEYANRTLFIYRNALNEIRSSRFKKLIIAVHEIEMLMENKFLDIEFAMDRKFNFYILQVRSITTQANWNRQISKNIDKALQSIYTFLEKKFSPIKGIIGKRTVFGQMPDWNPAEMIGRAPKALAFSLYEKLITDHAWRIARELMDYKVPQGQPLMVSLAGQPFIDTRLSFQSYLPQNLDFEISESLVNGWVSKLEKQPELHDKIEFDVAITTYSFDIDRKIEKLVGNILDTKQKVILKETFKKHFSEIIKPEHPGSLQNALEKIESLKNKQKETNSFETDNFELIHRMINDCINLGTIPFSILARHGFIAKTLALSLVEKEVISFQEYESLFNSITTIASDIVLDMEKMQSGTLSYEKFISEYGHLRPGTYDISSLRYDQMDHLKKFNSIFNTEIQKNKDKFYLSSAQKAKINHLLSENGLSYFNSEMLISYIKEATKAREYGKFIFTKSISNILEMISKFGDKHFLSRNELAHIPINEFIAISKHSFFGDVENIFRKISEQNKNFHIVTTALRLPQVLSDLSGIYIIPFQVSLPNFITNKKVTAKPEVIFSNTQYPNLNQKIVVIENADPGYDWIFSQRIAGLITKFGGANSHMAIRCAEFDIPAAIGCGEQRFNSIKKSTFIMLDCSSSLIQILN